MSENGGPIFRFADLRGQAGGSEFFVSDSIYLLCTKVSALVRISFTSSGEAASA